jgi:flavin reductase (DIM6/NTAB) family NADH-FMN oxidoreductase RutF
MSDAVDTYDEILDALEWPMVVVTASADDDGERGGCLVGFHTQCSIEPRRHLVMISVANHTATVVARATSLAVHLLRRDEPEIARVFGEQTADDPGVDKWEHVAVEPGSGPPILAGAAAWFAGPIIGRFDAGDHTAVLIQPDRAERRSELDESSQLGYQDAKGFDPGHPA